MAETIGAATRRATAGNGPRVRILDLNLDRVGMAEVLQRVEAWIREGRPGHVVTASIRFMSVAMQDRSFASIINGADLAVTDGMPLIWLSKLLGAPIPERITGPDLLLSLAKLAAERGFSVYLMGAAPGVAEDAATRLCAMHPGLKIAGTHHGYFDEDEELEVVYAIRRCRPQFLFVALGCPKQEFWIHRWMHELDVPVCIGVGGTLDILTGRLKRAPTWVQRAGLEWLYRLQQEPRRLWRRYLLLDIPTTLRAASSVLREVLASRMRWRRSQS